MHPDQPTGVPLAESGFFPHDTHRFSLDLRAYHFFDSTTFSASMSSACWATILYGISSLMEVRFRMSISSGRCGAGSTAS
jgi:hypothetical protein